MDTIYTTEVCELLAWSGLREICFGFESAVPRIQALMQKFENFNLEAIEQIVKNFSDVGVAVHFPVIIGFPSETYAERGETYAFLDKMSRLYNFTFNINVLELDIASSLYKNQTFYGITDIQFSDEKYFIGNFAKSWSDEHGSVNRAALVAEADEHMRNIMYPWMPKTTLVPPHIFYRISESLRAVLVWRTMSYSKKEITDTSVLVVTQSLVRTYDNLTEHFGYYNLESFQFLVDNSELLEFFLQPHRVSDAIQSFPQFAAFLEDYLQDWVDNEFLTTLP
ncbi:hypothetical protein FACS1894202_10790 [Clostridia bacterium]|nr:hypothetical protein FACS1894202_10790 [Clostridia bacterium]